MKFPLESPSQSPEYLRQLTRKGIRQILRQAAWDAFSEMMEDPHRDGHDARQLYKSLAAEAGTPIPKCIGGCKSDEWVRLAGTNARGEQIFGCQFCGKSFTEAEARQSEQPGTIGPDGPHPAPTPITRSIKHADRGRWLVAPASAEYL